MSNPAPIFPASADSEVFADAFSASPIGIAVESVEGRPLFVNPSLCAMFGFSEEEMRNKHCVEFSPPEDSAKDWALFQQLRAGEIKNYQIEKRYYRRDGSLMWGRLSVSMLEGRASPLVLAMVEDISQRKEMEEALAEVSRELVRAQENERARIARELHDDICQRLAVLSLELGQLEANPAGLELRRQELRKRIAEISEDLHALASDLHPSRLEYLGAAAGMKSWSEDFAQRHKIQIDFHADVHGALPLEIGVTLFRVLQEALQNAVKHSGAKRVEVRLRDDAGVIHMCITDKGRGFHVETESRGRGLGLTSMRERIRLVNGKIVIDSKPDGGTFIAVTVPFEAAPGTNGTA